MNLKSRLDRLESRYVLPSPLTEKEQQRFDELSEMDSDSADFNLFLEYVRLYCKANGSNYEQMLEKAEDEFPRAN